MEGGRRVVIGSAGRAKRRRVSLHAARAPPPPRGCSASGGFRAGAGGNHPGWVGGVETTLKQSCPVVLGAICVRQSNDSRGADHIAYRSSRRSSSTWGPRHPLAVLLIGFTCSPHWGREPPVVVVSCWRRLCWAHAQHLEGLCGVCGCWGVRWPKPRGVGAGPPLCSSKDRERERRLALHSGNDPSAGSPTETLLRLLLPSSEKIQPASHAHRRWLPSSCGAVRGFHRFAQSVAATGGVYKGQGRIQRALMRRAYKAFLVDDQQFQWSIPSTTGVQRLPTPIGAG